MIYNNNYQMRFYKDPKSGQEPVLGYLQRIDLKSRQKINKYLEFLLLHKGYLDEPYSRHLVGGLRELRVDFYHHHHRIIYFTYINREIILLHAFLKKRAKTPSKDKIIAWQRYLEVINN